MFGLLRTVLFTAAMQQGASKARRHLRLAALRAAIAVVGSLLILAGLAFLIAAGHAALAIATDERTASLICGVALVGLGGVAIAASRVVLRTRRIELPGPSIRQSAQDSVATLGHDIEGILSRNAGTLATGAFVAGLILAARRR